MDNKEHEDGNINQEEPISQVKEGAGIEERLLDSQVVYSHSIKNTSQLIVEPTNATSLKRASSDLNSKWWRYGRKVDIFDFEPVPRTEELSTRRSQIASIVLILIFLSYMGFTLYSFFFNDTPTLNTYEQPLSYTTEFPSQEFAFGFYQMDDSTQLIIDSTLFTYYLEQYSATDGEDNSQPVDFVKCSPSWSPVNISMLCPKTPMVLQGSLGKSSIIKYPRLKLYKCGDTAADVGVTCDEEGMNDLFPKGRLFIFVKQDAQTNFATGGTQPESGNFYYYFIVPTLFDRSEIVLTRKETTEHPNYGTFFTDKVSVSQYVSNNNLYVSDVSYFFTQSLLGSSSSSSSIQQNLAQQKNNFNPKDIIGNGKMSQQQSSKTQQLFHSHFSNEAFDDLGALPRMQNRQYSHQSIVENFLIQTNQTNRNQMASGQISAEFIQKNPLKADVVAPQPLFSWWFSLNPSQINVEVNYTTSARIISLWGGLWGVLAAAFTFIYLNYNAKRFYDNHQVWEKFETKLEVRKLSAFEINESVDESRNHSIS